MGLIAAGLTAGGMIYQGMMASQQAKTAQAVADYNAQLQEQQARQIEARTALAQKRQAKAATRKMGTLVARLGASGGVISEGAPLLIQATQASESEMENLMIGYEGAVKASQARSQGQIDRMQADIYGKSATGALVGGALGAGSTLLTGFSEIDWNKRNIYQTKKKAESWLD